MAKAVAVADKVYADRFAIEAGRAVSHTLHGPPQFSPLYHVIALRNAGVDCWSVLWGLIQATPLRATPEILRGAVAWLRTRDRPLLFLSGAREPPSFRRHVLGQLSGSAEVLAWVRDREALDIEAAERRAPPQTAPQTAPPRPAPIVDPLD
jgi:hypothetical protein